MGKRTVWFGVMGIAGLSCWIVSALGTGQLFLSAAAQENAKIADRRLVVLDREPVRIIEDPYPTFSGIALDTQRDEVFITNDGEASKSSLLVYGTQFPPTDKVMEPHRRVISPASRGVWGSMQLPCGVAISPEFQEMYTVTGDGQDVNIYPLQANGDAAPSRRLDVPNFSGGIFLDNKNDELFITSELANKISVYRRTARGEDDPLRYIQGPRTGLADPQRIYVDAEKNEIVVTNLGHWRKTEPGEGYALWGDGKLAWARGSFTHPGIVDPLTPSTGKFLPPSITVYRRDAQRDVAPLRTIQGPHTRLNSAVGIYGDPVSGQFVVANTGANSVLFFDRNANGDVAPVRVLEGPATHLKGPTGIAIDAKRNELWVTSWENHMTLIFSRTAEGNAAPLRYIRSAPKDAPLATVGRLGGVGFDPKRKEILAPN